MNPLIDSGLMPNLCSLMERGVAGKMATMEPSLSPLLWTTAATGMRPDRHGILGFLEPDSETGVPRLIGSSSRRVKAIWNILHESGLRSVVVNWFASHPAEPVNGVIVSDAYNKAVQKEPEPWPIVPGSVYPPELAETLASLRVHPAEIDTPELIPFIPTMDSVISPLDAKRLNGARRVLAENISVHGAATWLMENEPWDFLAVFYDSIDHFGHLFMQYHPPAMPGVPEADFHRYKDAMTGICCFHDLMLGRILKLAGPDATIMILSDHGLHSGNLRPTGDALYYAETPSLLHRSHGIFLIAGPGIRQDELVFGAGLLDVTPTILTLFGLPCGMDMEGRVLTEIFTEPPRVEKIPSWEETTEKTPRNVTAPGEQLNSALVMRQLADLGYVNLPEGDEAGFREAEYYNFNLARVLMFGRKFAEAVPVLEQLVASSPDEQGFQLFLAQCYSELGRIDDCRRLCEAVLKKDPNRLRAGLLLANQMIAEGRLEEALTLLLNAERSPFPAPGVRMLIGRTYVGLERWEDAARTFRQVIEIEPDHAPARAGLAKSLLALSKNQEAAEAALDAIRLRFDLPGAHYLLGIALARTGRVKRARQAFETCLKLEPSNPEPERWLAALRSKAASGRPLPAPKST